MIYNQNDIENLETRFRANLINSLGGFKSVVLIGTKSLQGNENLALFSSLFHIGANPAYCGFIIRPNEEKQNTLGNIVNTRNFTINHILPEFYKQAHQCSAKYDEGISEFKKTGFTAQYIDLIEAPFVEESNIKFACELVQRINIELNGTTLIIGKIIKIIAPESCIQNDGFINLEKAGSITCIGLDSYHQTNKIGRLSYAKVDKEIKEL
jgi:flavin reductase (DIM6/NTAB) family NADH-FMN oxidoreductase RutF